MKPYARFVSLDYPSLKKLGCSLDHKTGQVLAYVFGQRKDEVFLELKELLQPFGISRFYTDNWGAYSHHLEKQKHIVGKQNTQRIESKHINLRTRIKRLARKTICFSKTVRMHDIVIRIFINRYEARITYLKPINISITSPICESLCYLQRKICTHEIAQKAILNAVNFKVDEVFGWCIDGCAKVLANDIWVCCSYYLIRTSTSLLQ